MDMALVLAVVVLILVGFVFIVRPGKDKDDVAEPSTPAVAAAPSEDLPSQSSLLRMKKVDLEALALDRGVQHTGTKSDIVERLQELR